MLINIDAGKLFFINLDRDKMHIVLVVVAVLCVNYGLLRLIKGISRWQSRKEADD